MFCQYPFSSPNYSVKFGLLNNVNNAAILTEIFQKLHVVMLFSFWGQPLLGNLVDMSRIDVFVLYIQKGVGKQANKKWENHQILYVLHDEFRRENSTFRKNFSKSKGNLKKHCTDPSTRLLVLI